ncbi:cyclic nucleotide-binding domain-containing protein [Pararhodospirillum photometricum]|uniref:cyclic nucleotide-binding domain-containing protein n=1 Tax=Pararhodospirillum photometricum TaxID=1084 RepID=UPI000306A446|nr:cyclic nucleotide-binding domain-containing protein [Pararhodospirillum photometricum]
MSLAPLSLESGSLLFREGEAAASAFLILDGTVELTRTGPHGPLLVASLSKGDIAGEAGLLKNATHTVSAVAVGAVTVQELDRAALRDHLAEDPDTIRVSSDCSYPPGFKGGRR